MKASVDQSSLFDHRVEICKDLERQIFVIINFGENTQIPIDFQDAKGPPAARF